MKKEEEASHLATSFADASVAGKATAAEGSQEPGVGSRGVENEEQEVGTMDELRGNKQVNRN